MNKYFSKLDQDILLYVQNNLRSAKTDDVMKFITNLSDGGFIWLIISITLIISKKHRKTGFAMACTIAFGLIITNAIVKNTIQRMRPFMLIEELAALIPHPSDWSFPSGHATSSIGCGLIMLKHLHKTLGLTGLTLGILISASRVYLGVHYPSDVIAGAVAGTISAAAADRIVNKYDIKVSDK